MGDLIRLPTLIRHDLWVNPALAKRIIEQTRQRGPRANEHGEKTWEGSGRELRMMLPSDAHALSHFFSIRGARGNQLVGSHCADPLLRHKAVENQLPQAYAGAFDRTVQQERTAKHTTQG